MTTKTSLVKPAGIVSHWREVWKQWSTMALGLLLISPDILAAAVAQGWLDQSASHWAVRGIALLGIAAKYVSQGKPA